MLGHISVPSSSTTHTQHDCGRTCEQYFTSWHFAQTRDAPFDSKHAPHGSASFEFEVELTTPSVEPDKCTELTVASTKADNCEFLCYVRRNNDFVSFKSRSLLLAKLTGGGLCSNKKKRWTGDLTRGGNPTRLFTYYERSHCVLKIKQGLMRHLRDALGLYRNKIIQTKDAFNIFPKRSTVDFNTHNLFIYLKYQAHYATSHSRQ